MLVYVFPLETLPSLNKEVSPFSYAIIACRVFPQFLPLAITASGGPEDYFIFSLAIIAFEFVVPK